MSVIGSSDNGGAISVDNKGSTSDARPRCSDCYAFLRARAYVSVEGASRGHGLAVGRARAETERDFILFGGIGSASCGDDRAAVSSCVPVDPRVGPPVRGNGPARPSWSARPSCEARARGRSLARAGAGGQAQESGRAGDVVGAESISELQDHVAPRQCPAAQRLRGLPKASNPIADDLAQT